MVEMVCLHVISLMEALQECNSTIFVKVGKSYDFYRPFLAAKNKSGFILNVPSEEENKTDLVLTFRVGAGGFSLVLQPFSKWLSCYFCSCSSTVTKASWVKYVGP